MILHGARHAKWTCSVVLCPLAALQAGLHFGAPHASCWTERLAACPHAMPRLPGHRWVSAPAKHSCPLPAPCTRRRSALLTARSAPEPPGPPLPPRPRFDVPQTCGASTPPDSLPFSSQGRAGACCDGVCTMTHRRHGAASFRQAPAKACTLEARARVRLSLVCWLTSFCGQWVQTVSGCCSVSVQPPETPWRCRCCRRGGKHYARTRQQPAAAAADVTRCAWVVAAPAAADAQAAAGLREGECLLPAVPAGRVAAGAHRGRVG
jgi:hypothetical protein